MRFTIQSSELSSTLQLVGKAINPKHTLPIMDYFIFVLKDGKLEITASDQETTQISIIPVAKEERAGEIAVPSRLILDVLKEFSDQPITLDANPSTYEIAIIWDSGSIDIPGQAIYGYPNVKQINSDSLQTISLKAEQLLDSISTTIFATADKDIRPSMTGIFFDIAPESVTIVATDAHKLVRVVLNDPQSIAERSSFILPKKPATILKSLLIKESGDVSIAFDDKNICFTIGDTLLICRTIEGRYPNYSSVIPQNNPNKLIVDRVALLNSIKRVSICSDKSSNMVKMNIAGNRITLQARDTNFYVSAEDAVACSHDGDNITIGFKYMHLIEMLTVFTVPTIQMELADATRAGLFVAVDAEGVCEKGTVVILMPIM